MTTTFSTKPLRAALAAALALGGTVAAQAQSGVVNIDFNTASSPTYSGLGAYSGDTGTVWNGVTATYNSPTSTLKDSGGSATTVTFAFLGGNSYYVGSNDDNYSNGQVKGYDGSGNPIYGPELFEDYGYVNGNSQYFTLSGLNASHTYSLYLYGVGNAPDQTSSFEIVSEYEYGPPTAILAGPQYTGDNSGNHATGTATRSAFVGPGDPNNNYVVFSGLTPQTTQFGNATSPMITVLLGTSNSSYAAINGLQLIDTSLASAPEPSQFAAFGLGVLGVGALALRARKRTATSV